VSVFGQLPRHVRQEGSGPQPSFGAGRHTRGGPSHTSQYPPKDDNALELSADFVSVQTREMVGRVALRYTGASIDDALAKFGARLQSALPGAHCTPWKWTP